MGQKSVTEKRKEGGEETEKKDERNLIEEEWCSIMEDVHIRLLRGLKMIMKKFREEEGCATTEQRREVIERFFRAKYEFEMKDASSLEEVGDQAKTVLNQLEETLEVFGCSKEEVGISIFMRIDKLKLHENKYELEEVNKALEDQKKEEERLEKERIELKTLKMKLCLENEKIRKQLEILEKNASEFSYRGTVDDRATVVQSPFITITPQDRLTCGCHSRMGQFFIALGPR